MQKLLQPEENKYCWHFTTYAIYTQTNTTIALKQAACKYPAVFHSDRTGKPL